MERQFLHPNSITTARSNPIEQEASFFHEEKRRKFFKILLSKIEREKTLGTMGIDWKVQINLLRNLPYTPE